MKEAGLYYIVEGETVLRWKFTFDAKQVGEPTNEAFRKADELAGGEDVIGHTSRLISVTRTWER